LIRRRWRRDRGIVVALLIEGMIVRNAFAQSPTASGPPSGPERTVDVTIVAGGSEADSLMDSVRELFGRLGLAVNPHIL